MKKFVGALIILALLIGACKNMFRRSGFGAQIQPQTFLYAMAPLGAKWQRMATPPPPPR